MYDLTAPVLSLAVRLAFDLNVRGREHIPARGPALLVANHVSHLDPVVLLVVVHRLGRRVRFLAVSEAFQRPLIGWFMRAGRHIPVASGSRRLGSLRLARQALAAGELVFLYPEGTMSAEAAARARTGVALLAAHAGVPVIPLGTAGLEPGQPRRLRRRATVVVGEPLTLPPGHDRGSYQATGEAVLQRIRALVGEARDEAEGAPGRRRA